VDWATLNTTLLSILSELAADPVTAVPAFHAEWEDRPREVVSPYYQHSLTAKITNVDAFCEDEVRYEFDPDTVDPTTNTPGLFKATACGMRDITVLLKSTCLETTDDFWCMSVLERIRVGIFRNRHIDRLRDDANACVYDYAKAIDISTVVDGRMRSMGSMALMICAGMNDLDDVPDPDAPATRVPVPYQWIETVQLSSALAPRATTTLQIP